MASSLQGGTAEVLAPPVRPMLRRLEELVTDLLDARLLEEGRLELKREPTSLVELAERAMKTLEGRGAATGSGSTS